MRDENESVAFDLFSLVLLFPFCAHVKAAQVSDALWLAGLVVSLINSIAERSTAHRVLTACVCIVLSAHCLFPSF